MGGTARRESGVGGAGRSALAEDAEEKNESELEEEEGEAVDDWFAWGGGGGSGVEAMEGSGGGFEEEEDGEEGDPAAPVVVDEEPRMGFSNLIQTDMQMRRVFAKRFHVRGEERRFTRIAIRRCYSKRSIYHLPFSLV